MMADKGKKPMTRSKTATDEKKRRSQRNVSPKNMDDAVSGMSRQEEQDLNRAIHLSLQEARRQSRADRTRVDRPDPNNQTSQSLSSPQPSTSTQHVDESCCSMDSVQSSSGAGQCLSMSNTSTASTSTESSKSSSPEPKKVKYHAQRKFAANAFIQEQPERSPLQMPPNWRSLSLDTQLKYLAFVPSPSMPAESHYRPRYQSLPHSCFPFYPDVDDLLTWMCFKDLMPLPRHLDLLNLSKEEYDSYHPKSDRDSGLVDSPSAASSSSVSHQTEDSRDMSDMNQQKQQTPKKKAARASASTPQTARGLANLRSSTKTSQTTEPKPSPEKRKKKAESSPSPFKSPHKHPVSDRSASSAEGTFKSPRKHPVSDRLASSVEGSFKNPRKGPVSDRSASSAEGTFKNPHKGLVSDQSASSTEGTFTSPHKSPVSDRSALKRKAASMPVGPTRSPEKQKRKSRLPIPDSDPPVKKHFELEQRLIKRSGCSSRLRSKSIHFRKHKSENEQEDTPTLSITSPLKQLKLELSTRSNVNVTTRAMDVVGKSKSKYDDVLETHPSKHLSTRTIRSSNRPKRKFKPHRPMTRAATHMKNILKAAKIAANKKLRMMGRTLPKANDYTKLSRIVESKRHSVGLERKRSSWTSTSSKLSCSSGDSPSESHMKTEHSPSEEGQGSVMQCPTYHPTVEQFRDPILYIQSIQSEAKQYGMCKIVPPGDWKMESHELEDSHFRFTSQIQYIHKMMHKWSPITEQLECIKRLYNDAGNKELVVPQIGGIEIDLVKLYDLAKKYGGMKETAGKEKKWMKIAEAMNIPKRVSKLYAAYCKYLVAYETLSDEERSKLTEKVQEERKLLENGSECIEAACYQCVFKGTSQMLSRYHKIAQNVQQLYCPDENMHVEDIESHYWDIVNQSNKHVFVQGANLDTSVHGSMFPVGKDAQYARHSWNLHNFVKGKGSVLQHLGLIAGVTVPTLHIGMLYSSTCLACNGHNLPTVHYLHQGPGLIWYAVPSHEVNNLKSALKHIVPTHVREKGFFLEQDSIMVPPAKLVKKGVSMSRCVQSPREFIVVFPSVYYSNISLGYNLSESVHYGTQDWIPEGYKASLYLGLNHSVELFSMDALLVFLAQDQSTPDTTLIHLLPYLEKVVDREITERKQLHDSGLKTIERLEPTATKTTQKLDILEEIIICDVSKKLCYLSVVLNPHENSAFSLQQGLIHIQKRKNLKNYKLMYRFSEDELRSLIREVKNRLKDGYSSSSATSSPKRKTRKSVLDAKYLPVASSSTQ